MTSGLENDEEKNANKGTMWDMERKLDQPMDEEAGKLKNMYREKKFSSWLVIRLAYQSLGVVYGDLGTSPLYVFYNTFPHGVDDPEDVIGALSLIIYSLTLVPLLKYVFIVLRANDNGQGGTLALYSLLCRHANIKTIPNQHRTDEDLTTYSRTTIHERSFAAKTQRWLEGNFMKHALLILVLVGTCMVIGDGILTPAISGLFSVSTIFLFHLFVLFLETQAFCFIYPMKFSDVVLSAAGGIRVNKPEIDNRVIVIIAVIILVGLFSVQHYGTDRVGWLFAPIVLVWLLLIGGIGIYNIRRFGGGVLRAFSPLYMYRYIRNGKKESWLSLGGILLSITGTEALFADLANYPVSSVQLAFTLLVFPCLLLAYSGQAAYLVNNLHHSQDVFYRSIPDKIYWPVFIIATIAAIVASQATITATFSIIKQALAHGCFPRVKVVHTSKKFLGQIYIPDINWMLMVLCIAVTAGFKNQSQIGNAYGTAVVLVMLVTTLLMILVMILVWHCHWILVIAFTGSSLLVECTYFSAVLFKVDQGGWAPLAIAGVFLVIMYVWHYGTLKRYEFELHSKVSMAWILGLGPSLGLVRVPGIGLVYTELASGVPHIFSHFITNLPAIHSVVVFVCVKYLPVYTVPEDERFLVKRIGPKNFHIFRCVARYGYKDLHKKDDSFEKKLFHNLFMFVRLESMMEDCSDSEYSICEQQNEQSINNGNTNSVRKGDLTISSVDSIVPARSPHVTFQSSSPSNEVDEYEFLTNSREAGVVHILGNTVVIASRDSRFYKKIAVDYIYAFLRKICRENSVIFNIPHESLLNVGQVFYV
ncbi:potassium transporter 11-like isoform X1 [Vicia villosa]|uniref:potassium transporter 11-like isoform X1 n=1 Tax=Vicia villosa TaxID=3911 RepID=UPI00273C4FD4|nr:potassium transporter 11-like isoform X1 [Vicia villosa]XP_058765883.1 potassium transporter 11-like isoform X1 [Vicia villosa]